LKSSFRSIARLLHCLVLGLACAAGVSPAFAQAYPAKPLKFIVPFPAGGGTDFVARTVGNRLSTALGQPVVTDNRPGAAGMIGVESAARSPADGYTVLIAGVGELTINPGLYRKITYDTNKDLQAVSLIAKNPFLLVVNPKVLPVTDVQGFIRYAKANPGKINYASFGAGSIAHVMTEAFRQRADIVLTHVPYKGAAPAVQDLVGGQVAAMFVDYGAAKGHISAGTLRPIAVSTKERHPALPSIPTVAESGIANFDAFSWIGSMVPAGIPGDVLARLNAEIVKAVASPEVQKHFADHGVLPMTNTPEQHSQFVRQEIERWNGVVKTLGLTLD
jgi:tripartite-type tricarboxylate transporter receptor subunit TctC